MSQNYDPNSGLIQVPDSSGCKSGTPGDGLTEAEVKAIVEQCIEDAGGTGGIADGVPNLITCVDGVITIGLTVGDDLTLDLSDKLGDGDTFAVPSGATAPGVDSFGFSYSAGDTIVTFPDGSTLCTAKSPDTFATGAPSLVDGVDSAGNAFSVGDYILTLPNGDVLCQEKTVNNGDDTFAVTITADADGTDTAGNPFSNGDTLIELANGDTYCVKKATLIAATAPGTDDFGNTYNAGDTLLTVGGATVCIPPKVLAKTTYTAQGKRCVGNAGEPCHTVTGSFDADCVRAWFSDTNNNFPGGTGDIDFIESLTITYNGVTATFPSGGSPGGGSSTQFDDFASIVAANFSAWFDAEFSADGGEICPAPASTDFTAVLNVAVLSSGNTEQYDPFGDCPAISVVETTPVDTTTYCVYRQCGPDGTISFIGFINEHELGVTEPDETWDTFAQLMDETDKCECNKLAFEKIATPAGWDNANPDGSLLPVPDDAAAGSRGLFLLDNGSIVFGATLGADGQWQVDPSCIFGGDNPSISNTTRTQIYNAGDTATYDLPLPDGSTLAAGDPVPDDVMIIAEENAAGAVVKAGATCCALDDGNTGGIEAIFTCGVDADGAAQPQPINPASDQIVTLGMLQAFGAGLPIAFTPVAPADPDEPTALELCTPAAAPACFDGMLLTTCNTKGDQWERKPGGEWELKTVNPKYASQLVTISTQDPNNNFEDFQLPGTQVVAPRNYQLTNDHWDAMTPNATNALARIEAFLCNTDCVPLLVKFWYTAQIQWTNLDDGFRAYIGISNCGDTATVLKGDSNIDPTTLRSEADHRYATGPTRSFWDYLRSEGEGVLLPGDCVHFCLEMRSTLVTHPDNALANRNIANIVQPSWHIAAQRICGSLQPSNNYFLGDLPITQPLPWA